MHQPIDGLFAQEAPADSSYIENVKLSRRATAEQIRPQVIQGLQVLASSSIEELEEKLNPIGLSMEGYVDGINPHRLRAEKLRLEVISEGADLEKIADRLLKQFEFPEPDPDHELILWPENDPKLKKVAASEAMYPNWEVDFLRDVGTKDQAQKAKAMAKFMVEQFEKAKSVATPLFNSIRDAYEGSGLNRWIGAKSTNQSSQEPADLLNLRENK